MDQYILGLALAQGWEALLLRDVAGRYDGDREVWTSLYVFMLTGNTEEE